MERRAGGTADPAGFMLRTGASHLERGEIYQAMHLYFQVLDRYPGSDEAAEAERRLVGMAHEFEENGQLYAAKGLYDTIAAMV